MVAKSSYTLLLIVCEAVNERRKIQGMQTLEEYERACSVDVFAAECRKWRSK